MDKQLGAIAAGHDAAARAGAEALADGGNAIDAVACAAFCSCTCEPTLTGPGGAGFLVTHLADGSDHAFDFFATTPGYNREVDSALGPVPVDVLFGTTNQTFHVGPQSCAVPGFLLGVLNAHARFGRLPRSRILEPGIALARDGLILTERQSYCHSILSGIVMRTPRGREIFGPDGPMLAEGERFRQPKLATTLELIQREGPATMYTGEIAREIVRWSDDNDGLISAEDLSAYKVREVEPVRGRFRDYEMRGIAPASSGGVLVAFALNILDSPALPTVNLHSRNGVATLAHVLDAASAMRGPRFDDFLYDGGDLVGWLLSPENLAAAIEVVRATLDPDASALDIAPSHPSSRLGSTTHVSCIDGDGNAVAMTTSTGCGAGEWVTDTGIHLNNMLGEEDLMPSGRQLHPGDRLTSMMAPTVLLDARGQPVLATGSAGSSRIRSAVVQTLVRAVEAAGERSIRERVEGAVGAPRIHSEEGILHAEPGFPEAALERLESDGYDVQRWPEQNLYFGGVNMVGADSAAGFAAAGDRRRGGGAYVVHAGGRLENQMDSVR